MADTVKLNQVEDRFEDLSYPVARDDAANEYADTTVLFADGEANLGDMIRETTTDQYEDPSELYSELQNVMPIEAVGEPGQSEGDS